MIKHLIQHGNSKALVIDKALLQTAGLDESTPFQIVVIPNEGIVIQSVKTIDENLHKQAFKQMLQENDTLMRRLAKR